MIITKNWLNDFIDISSLDTQSIANKLNSIGHEVASVDEFIFDKNLVVGFVKTKKPHPDANKLSVCEVDLGEKTEQIVCGAPNVRANSFVVVAKNDAKLGDIVIKNTTIRGVESNGMICSAKELGLGDFENGILELDESIGNLVCGKELNKYKILNDAVIDLDITPNRGDCLSIHGIARELGVAFGITPRHFSDLFNEQSIGIGRFATFKSQKLHSKNLFKIAHIKDTKLDLISRLRLFWTQNISSDNIQNITRYASYASGVVIDAFACEIDEEKNILIEIKNEDDFDVCYLDGKKLCTNGISIEYDSLANVRNKTVLFKASYTDPTILCKNVFEKKTKKTQDIFTRASKSTETDLQLGMDYLRRFFKGASFYAQNLQNPFEYTQKTINLDLDYTNKTIGQEQEKNIIVKILKSLNFEILVSSEQNSLNVIVPAYRYDINNRADLVEEILRIVGIDSIEPKPMTITQKNNHCTQYETYKNERNFAKKAQALGSNECINFVFSHSQFLQKLGYEPLSEDKKLLNPISSDLDTLRPSLVPNLLKTIQLNKRKSKTSINVFEIGSIFDSLRKETRMFCLAQSGFGDEAMRKEKVNFESFSTKVLGIFGELDFIASKDNQKLYHQTQHADIYDGNHRIGKIYKLSLETQKELDLDDTFICEINLNEIKKPTFKTRSFSHFQASTRDISFVLDDNVSFAHIKEAILYEKFQNLASFYPSAVFIPQDLKGKKSLTISFVMQSMEKTLEEDELNNLTQKIIDLITKRFGASLR